MVQHNNAFLIFDTETCIAKRIVDGKPTGESAYVDKNTDYNRKAFLQEIDNFRLMGDGE
jgi:hypothetical protein